MMTTKKRAFITAIEKWNGYSTFNNGVLFSKGSTNPVTFGQAEILIGTSHPFPVRKSRYKGKHPRKVLKTGTFDAGGAVYIAKASYNAKAQTATCIPSATNGIRTYPGKDCSFLFFGPSGIPAVPSTIPVELSDSILLAQGVRAWAASKPTASQGGLGQALGELHDLPKIPEIKALRDALSKTSAKTARNLAKSTGSNYLNIVFGWLPLVSDVKDLVKNIRDFNKNLSQLERDNGQGVRRSKKIHGGETTTVQVYSGSGLVTVPNMLFFPNIDSTLTDGWTATVTTQTNWDYRFSARFRYYIDFAKAYQGSYREAARMARILFGADLSPYTVYQLMPWSWAIDWITNIGANLSNARDSEDHLTADYAYINGRMIVETKYTLSVKLKGDSMGSRTFEYSSRVQYFRRIGASPFGFGLTFSGFNLKQKAILGALGLTKLL